jgi:hypothetical protein
MLRLSSQVIPTSRAACISLTPMADAVRSTHDGSQQGHDSNLLIHVEPLPACEDQSVLTKEGGESLPHLHGCEGRKIAIDLDTEWRESAPLNPALVSPIHRSPRPRARTSR